MKYFASDVHLSADRPETVSLFLKFLSTIKAGNELYLLGDIFDTWIGDDDDTPLADQIRQALQHLTQSGVTVFFQAGNRDFLIDQQFLQQTGLQPLSETAVINVNGDKILLMHGDLLCTDDIEYQQARVMLRNPLFVQDFLSKPLQERRIMAAQYRQRSGETTSLKAADIMDINQDTLAKYLQTSGARHIIHGHTHRPATHQLEAQTTSQRYVLGEWHADHAQILTADEQGIMSIQVTH